MIDTAAVINSILPDLHAEVLTELTFWTESDLIRWQDECVKHLSHLALMFVVRDTTIVTAAAGPRYNLPPRHVTTLHVSLGATPLRPANVEELEGLDPAFQSSQGTPERWYEDKIGTPELALAPVPDTGGVAVPVVYSSWPPEIDVNKVNTTLAAPAPLKGYMAMAILSEAYGSEGEAEMPDVAAHCRGRLALYEQLFQGYYGKGI